MKRRLAWVAACWLAAGAATATTNELSEAEIEGRDLVQQLLEQRPAENFTNTGTMHIRNAKGERTNVPFSFQILVTSSNWLSVYDAKPGADQLEASQLVITRESHSNRYELNQHLCTTVSSTNPPSIGPKTPFSSSDFWFGDLGLEFFHWPAQKILKHEMKRGQACKVLESRNPEPSINGYSRVVSWIDNDTLGIVQAEAYDAKGKLLKEFAPKEFKKVNGQWQLQEMEIRNVQTGSRTRLQFDLDKK